MDSGELQEPSGGGVPKPVLIILHQEQSTPGHIGRLLAERGHPLDIRRPRFGEPLPTSLAGHAGTVIFGGPMSANDCDEFVRREISLIELSLKEASPFLGICLGAQMMSVCLGAKVAPHPDGFVEMGYYDVEPVSAASIGGDWPTRFYQWHSEGFELPSGAEALVRSEGPFPNQAFRFGRAAVGLQFHPEITYAMAARWSGRNETKLPERRGAQLRSDQLADHIVAAPQVRRWLDGFLEAWLTLPVGANRENGPC